MMKTRSLIFIILVAGTGYLNGQITFNKRTSFNTLATYLTSIVVTDSCYFVTGLFADTIPFVQVGGLFAKINLEGEVLFVKKLISTEQPYFNYVNTLTALQDGNFAVTGLTYDPVMKGMLIKYNSLGDTLWTREYLNPFYPDREFIHPLAMAPTPDGGFAISCWIEKAFGNADIYLIKTDSLGNKEWGKVYGHYLLYDRPESLVVTPDNKIILGAIRTNSNTTNEDYFYRAHIFQVDSLGNFEWEYISPFTEGLKDAANDIILLEDGSLVIVSGIGTEYERTSVNVVWFEKMLFKLNTVHEVEWESVFIGDQPTSFTTLKRGIQLSDGSGYVAAGITPQPLENPFSNDWVSEGWLVKVSLEGDSIWSRSYVGVESESSRHQILDLKETTDGGIILCGESRNPYADSIPQQAWLLKLDAFGCLVPGCQITSSKWEESAKQIRLDIFPNPTTDYLNIYFKARQDAEVGTFRIIDAQGRIMKTFQSDRSDVTFLLPVWEWSPGIYFLQYWENEKIKSTRKFIKQ